MKKTYFIGTTLVVLVLLISACSPVAVPTTMPSTYAPPAVIPVTGATVPASIMVGKNDTLGSFLVDDKNMTLYLFTKDTPNTSNCYDKCATAWPPLLTKGAPIVGTGVDGSIVGTTTRKDGSEQVTYNGWPLYYYIKDAKAGDVTGQNVGEVWFVITPVGEMIKPAAALPEVGTTVMVGKNDTLGSFLVDAKNMTLYLYTKDTPNTSNCYDKCATAWPPLLTTGSPIPGTGVDDSKLGTTKRTDGSMQVTYNGWPLYYYIKDSKPGDVTGQNVGSVWFVITPDGKYGGGNY